MIGKAGKLWWAFLALILFLAVWLSNTGRILLYGFPIEVLEAVARGRGLIPAAGQPMLDGLAVLGRLPGDGLAWAGALTTAMNCLAALVLYAATRRAWKNPVGPVLALGAAFFGTQTMWVESVTPRDSLLHLLLALSLAALINGAVPVLSGLVLATAVLSPSHALMLYLGLAYLSYRRQAAYGLWVPTLALFGVGCLLIPMAGAYRLQPSLAGWQLASFLPLFLCFAPSQIRAARGGIYASLLLGSWLTGTGELASILALGDLAFVALDAQGQKASAEAPPPESPPEPEWRLSRSLLVSGVATIVLISVVLPGERYLNSEVLIPAQKSKVPLGRLFGLFSLEAHAKGYAHEPWRANVPFPDLSAADCELAIDLSNQELPDGFCPLTLDFPTEERQIALLYALIAGRRLNGWDDSRHLAAPMLLCKLRQKNFLHRGPKVVLRKDRRARIADPAILPAQLAPLDFRGILGLPYRPQEVSREPGGAYRWSSGEQTYDLAFVDQNAEILLSSRAGEYQVTSLSEGGASRRLEIPEMSWEISEIVPPESLPSRSLVPLSFRLKNRGNGPISSDLIASWRLQTVEAASFSAFDQPTPVPFILYPGESVRLSLQLATPEPEGQYSLKATVLTPQGEELEVPMAGLSAVTTWRRLPAVGTWVEEP